MRKNYFIISLICFALCFGVVYFANASNDTFNIKDYGAKCNGVDDSAALNAALLAAYNNNGGTVVIPIGGCLISSQINIPNDGVHVPMHTGKPIKIVGQGSTFLGGGSGLNMTYSGPGGKINAFEQNYLEISGINFVDSSGSDTPFIYVTNATVFIHDNTFIGTKIGTNCNQDAIVLGGTSGLITNDYTGGFNGYQSHIERNTFWGIRRAVYGRQWANGITIKDNYVTPRSGSNIPGGAAFEFNGSPSLAVGNLFSGNLIEVLNYAYGFTFSNDRGNTLIGNTCFDPIPGRTLGCIYFSPTSGNDVAILGWADYRIPYVKNDSTLNNVVVGLP